LHFLGSAVEFIRLPRLSFVDCSQSAIEPSTYVGHWPLMDAFTLTVSPDPVVAQ